MSLSSEMEELFSKYDGYGSVVVAGHRYEEWIKKAKELEAKCAAQQAHEADADRCPICGDRLTDLGDCPRD